MACSALAVLLAAAPGVAQDTGTASGTVVDATRQVVPGAAITLTNEATAGARTMPSNERGDFTFRTVPLGSYTVRVELTGVPRHRSRTEASENLLRLDRSARVMF
jgi:hypothetical protein